ncbi:uncharacterized protein LOC110813446 [Carica papaya]|uniref:uncharacterized protein LOC110813446 n=1 Tax=Carica papaya TaxID=3649 RepID=UPI000B8CE10C|nr:uncharacterized protein LOC110813446 [Carica papaya]
MQSASLPISPFTPRLGRPLRKRVSTGRVFASHREGWSVDENMIVLRKRIHEMKMVERNYEPPANWMEWEKRFYTSYDSFIYQLVGALQSRLMNTRPSLALGMIALVVISVPVSSGMVFIQLLEMVKMGLGAGSIHLS